jgi:hypothetical protein
MDEHNDEQQEPKLKLVLDGSFGAGPLCEVTIITKAETGQKEETFYVPYFLLDKIVLQKLVDLNFILGYKLVKNERVNPALKELGL